MVVKQIHTVFAVFSSCICEHIDNITVLKHKLRKKCWFPLGDMCY